MHRGERAKRTFNSTSLAACGQLQQATGSGDASWEEPRTGRTGATRTWARPGKGGGPALEYHTLKNDATRAMLTKSSAVESNPTSES